MTTKDAPKIQKSEKDKKKEWLEEILPVEFFNLEEPGVGVKFPFGPTNNTKTYTLLHGGKYNLTREVVQHVESRQTPIWGYKPDGRGVMQKSREGFKSRFQCRQTFE